MGLLGNFGTSLTLLLAHLSLLRAHREHKVSVGVRPPPRGNSAEPAICQDRPVRRRQNAGVNKRARPRRAARLQREEAARGLRNRDTRRGLLAASAVICFRCWEIDEARRGKGMVFGWRVGIWKDR